jgi:transglutaminase-like putative cysteine protease
MPAETDRIFVTVGRRMVNGEYGHDPSEPVRPCRRWDEAHLLYWLWANLSAFNFSSLQGGELEPDHPRPLIILNGGQGLVKIEAGYDIAFQGAQDVPMLLMLTVHPSRQQDLLSEHHLQFSPPIPARDYLDTFGNVCTRLVAPSGVLKIRNRFIIRDSGKPDEVAQDAEQWDIERLPDDALVYLLGSRYCDTQKLSDIAWAQFGGITGGWRRVQAICDYVHARLEFGYHHARDDRTAAEGHDERIGVCRDFAHLAVTLCRCMNIPARYCTGYLGDIGVPRDPAPMDFSAWFEVFLGGRWYTFDARHNHPRIGRILIGRGRDAADVAISTAFGPAQLATFTVVTEELDESAGSPLVPNQSTPVRSKGALQLA